MDRRKGYVLAIALWAVVLCGCGTPAGLERAMEGFAEAAAENEQALKDLDHTASQRLTEIRQKQAVEGINAGGEIVLVRPVSRANCNFEAPGCELRLMTRQEFDSQKLGDRNAGAELNVGSLIPNQLAVAREISLYATGLKQIATADHTDGIRQGVEAAMSGVCGLAGTLGTIMGAGAVASPACEAFRAPIASLVAFVYGEYQAHAKLSALRHATNEIQPLLEQVANVFSISAEFSLDGDVRRLTEAYDQASNDWENERTEVNLRALLDAAAHLDAALKARAQLRSEDSVFRAFESAHKKVLDTLETGDKDLSIAMAEIEQLVGKAKQLAKIARDFRTAIEKAK